MSQRDRFAAAARKAAMGRSEMRRRKQNIYYNLISDENSFTEGFCNMLLFDGFRRVFIEFLQENLHQNDLYFDFDEIQTQESLGEEGRPDLVVKTDKFLLYIECKIRPWTLLTPNQPQSYLTSLTLLEQQNVGRKFLIFLLPDRYDHEESIIERYGEFNADHPHHGIGCEILKWSKFHQALQKAGLPQLNTGIQHFSEVLKNLFSIVEIRLSRGDNHDI